ncbi:expressed protein [Phakopsora pachyrhizi]|uniref:Expressed protein n=1 Tax=Phakopsora pachyrhizi TaxID=170000 RepID=A0AAV0B9C0_PHAPC|nr:expressed protein [Phakopsora pachyrhizi]
MDPNRLRMIKLIKDYLRSYNRLVAYLRMIHENGNILNLSNKTKLISKAIDSFDGSDVLSNEGKVEIFKLGRAACFKVWVSCNDYWMNNQELVECERELWRSGVWPNLRKGDLCWNLAIGDFGNEGRLIFDGSYCRDLGFEVDEIGHLPSWLNMMQFPVAYFHKLIFNSHPSSMIVYLDLSRFKRQITKNMKLIKDQVDFNSTLNRYRLQKWIYRTEFNISEEKPVIGDGTGDLKNQNTIDPSWYGSCVIEIESTSEKVKEVMHVIGSVESLRCYLISCLRGYLFIYLFY